MIELAPWTRLGLLMIRPAAIVVATPPFGGMYVPAPVKVGLAVLLTIVLAPLVPFDARLTTTALAAVAVREAVIGLALSLSVRLVIAGAELAGHLAGFQLGFAYAATVDPQSGARNNLLGVTYGSLALVLLLLANGHHVVLRALVESYRALPIGFGAIDTSLAPVVAQMLGLVFVLGAQLAAPVVVVVLLAEVVLALVARAAPALNIMVAGYAVRTLVGLLALAAGMAVVPAAVVRLFTPAVELAARLASAFR